jgi:hypothetical protein
MLDSISGLALKLTCVHSPYLIHTSPLPYFGYSRQSLLLEHRKRDRLLCYVLAAIMGPALVPTLQHPDQQKPSVLMALPVSPTRCSSDALHSAVQFNAIIVIDSARFHCTAFYKQGDVQIT